MAHTGVGKTREAVNLLQILNQEGWTILNLTHEGWLDVPARLPKDVPDRKLVFFLDDLNRKCYASRVEQAPQAGEVLQPLTVPLQDRLRRALEAYVILCGGMGEIRVVATARDETIPDAEHEPSPRDMLQCDKYADFWKRFRPYYPLPQPDTSASAKAFTEIAQRAGVKLVADPAQLARRNDGTFANIVQNLEIVHVEQTALTLEIFRDTLKGTWQRRYQAACRKHPAAQLVYEAVELLRDLNIDLAPFIVEPTAGLIAGGNGWRRWRQRWQIRVAVRYLQSAETILAPRDGQIEAKGTRVDSGRYLLPLSSLIYKLADQYGVALQSPAFNLAISCYYAHHLTESARLLGLAIRLDPNDARAYNNRGLTYAAQKDYAAALADYGRAIELDPNDATAYNNRGLTYAAQKDYAAALADYEMALKLDPSDDAPAYNTACAYALQNHVVKACSWLRQAIVLSDRSLDMAHTDSDFDAIRDTPEFKALMQEFENKPNQT